jgi:hypothetical protein
MVPTPDPGWVQLPDMQPVRRPWELLGLRERRVDLTARRIKVVDVRYAGRFGSGYKDRPKSDASIRPLPMAEQVTAAMTRRLSGCGRDELVFCGPGGSNGVPRRPGPGARRAVGPAGRSPGKHEGSIIGTRYRGDASRSSPPPRSGCHAGRPAAGRLAVPSRRQAHRVVVTLAGSSGLPPVFTAGSRAYAAFGGVTATHSVFWQISGKRRFGARRVQILEPRP